MHPDDVLGPRRHRGEVDHRQRRRGRGEDRAGPAHLVEGSEQLLLRAEVLDDRLDDEVHLGEVVGRRRRRHPLDRRLRVGADIRPFCTARATDRDTAATTPAAFSGDRATAVTAYPDRANTSTIPDAIVPEPTTPTRATGRTDPPPAPTQLGVSASGTTADEPGSAYV